MNTNDISSEPKNYLKTVLVVVGSAIVFAILIVQFLSISENNADKEISEKQYEILVAEASKSSKASEYLATQLQGGVIKRDSYNLLLINIKNMVTLTSPLQLKALRKIQEVTVDATYSAPNRS